MNSAMAIDIVQTAAKLAAAEAERDRAIEVADAETKGVYSQYMLEAADAIAELRSTRIKLADTEASYCAMAKVARDAQSALEACRSALPRSFD